VPRALEMPGICTKRVAASAGLFPPHVRVFGVSGEITAALAQTMQTTRRSERCAKMSYAPVSPIGRLTHRILGSRQASMQREGKGKWRQSRLITALVWRSSASRPSTGLIGEGRDG